MQDTKVDAVCDTCPTELRVTFDTGAQADEWLILHAQIVHGITVTPECK